MFTRLKGIVADTFVSVDHVTSVTDLTTSGWNRMVQELPEDYSGNMVPREVCIVDITTGESFYAVGKAKDIAGGLNSTLREVWSLQSVAAFEGHQRYDSATQGNRANPEENGKDA